MTEKLTHWRENYFFCVNYICGIVTFIPLRRMGRPPQNRCLHFPGRTWRRWSCTLPRTHRSLWHSPPGSEDWGPPADPSSWPTGPQGPQLSWRPNRSHRNPVRRETQRGLMSFSFVWWSNKNQEWYQPNTILFLLTSFSNTKWLTNLISLIPHQPKGKQTD